jgi:hypothetical protein
MKVLTNKLRGNTMKWILMLLMALTVCIAQADTSIVLTQAQVDSVLAQNPPEPCEECPIDPPVEPPIDPPVEPPVEPPIDPTVCDVTLRDNHTMPWATLFSAVFPNPLQGQERISIKRKGYYAVKFTTPAYADEGFLTNIEAAGTRGYRLGAVSRTKGCFDVAEDCTHKWGSSGGIFWSTAVNPPPRRCKLLKNTTYYWNMTFTDGTDPESFRCGTYCQTILQVSNR